jgi:AraC family transcriptional regulator
MPRYAADKASTRSRRIDLPGLRLFEATYGAGFVTPWHEHEHGCVTVVLDGLMGKELRGDERTLVDGDAAVTPADAPHVDRFGPAGSRVVVVELLGQRAPALARADVRLCFPWLSRRLAAELDATDDAAELALHGAALELLAAAGRAAAAERSPRWLDDVVDYVHEHAFERLTLDELAAVAGVHRTRLTRAFRDRHGVSIGDYVRQLRVTWAAERLRSTDDSIAEIAAAAGFADQSHFSRVFRARFGIPPGRDRASR